MSADLDVAFVASDEESSGALIRRSSKVKSSGKLKEKEANGTEMSGGFVALEKESSEVNSKTNLSTKTEAEINGNFTLSVEESSGSLVRRSTKVDPKEKSKENDANMTEESEMDSNASINGNIEVGDNEVQNAEEKFSCPPKVKITERYRVTTSKQDARHEIREIINGGPSAYPSNDSAVVTAIPVDSPHSKAPVEPSVYCTEEGLWKCRHCSWVYAAIKPRTDLIQKHKENCEGMNNVQPLSEQVFPIKHKFQEGSESSKFLDGGQSIEYESKETQFIESEKAIETATEIKKNQKWNNVESNWQIGSRNLETSTKVYVTQSFVTENFDQIKETEKGKNVCLDSRAFSEIGSTMIVTNGELITNEEQERTENAGVKQHQQGNIVSEFVIQNSQDRFVGAQDQTQLKEHWTGKPEKTALEGNVEDCVKLLKEQKSHDLLCPVCGSCITKRVILRKRKRTSLVSYETWHQEANDDEQLAPPEGEHEIQITVPANEDSEETEAYGCLSCFSLFFRRVAGVKLFPTKSESGSKRLTEQYSPELLQDTSHLVDREKESFYCLPFLYPWGHTVKKESKRVAVEELTSSRPNRITGHLDNTTAMNTTLTDSRTTENVEIRETKGTASMVLNSTQYMNGDGESPQLDEKYPRLPNAQMPEGQHRMSPSIGIPTLDGQIVGANFEISNQSTSIHESHMDAKNLDRLTESQESGKQHLNQEYVKATEDRLTETHCNGSAALTKEHKQAKTEQLSESIGSAGKEHKQVKTEQLGESDGSSALSNEHKQVETKQLGDSDGTAAFSKEHKQEKPEQLGEAASIKPVDMFPGEIETDDDGIRPHLATQYQASSDLSAAPRDEESPRSEQQLDNLKQAVRQGESDSKDYLSSFLPISIPAGWSIWSSTENTTDLQLKEPLLANVKDTETFDWKVPAASTDDNERGALSLLKSDSVETQDPATLAKSKVDESITQRPEVSPDSGKILISSHATVETVIQIEKTDDPQPSNAATAVSEVTQSTSTQVQDPNEVTEWELLKSIVYGGLNVSITSLGVVSATAGGEAKTLTVIAIGLANLVSGLFLIFSNILYLEHFQQDQFRETIGHSFWFNGFIAIFSYLIFGSLAPVTYGFSFQKSDDTLYKFVAASLVSLLSIVLLALGKARVTKKSYIKIVILYIVTGFWASIIGFFAGEYIKKLLEKWGIKVD